MKPKLKLYSHIMKVQGKRNWVLEDLLQSRLYKVIPEGDDETFRNFLLEKQLAFETTGVKIQELDFFPKSYLEFARLRHLTIRIQAGCRLECQDCGSICSCYKGGEDIDDATLSLIIKQTDKIEIDKLCIIGGDPFEEIDRLKNIKKRIKAKKYIIVFRDSQNKRAIEIADRLGFEIRAIFNDKRKIKETTMMVDRYSFFYQKEFNPCWGNSIAVESNGDIKPCLWSDLIKGNVHGEDIKDLILDDKLAEYWNIKKDDIEICRECEYRYACSDCRVDAIKLNGSRTSKTPNCAYDPSTGKWEK